MSKSSCISIPPPHPTLYPPPTPPNNLAFFLSSPEVDVEVEVSTVPDLDMPQVGVGEVVGHVALQNVAQVLLFFWGGGGKG